MLNINDFSMDFFSLKGKNAIVTGGNSGLGQAFALALAKAGANIFTFAYVDDDGTTKKLIEDCGVKYTFMQGDLTEDGMCDKVAEKCVETYGSIDILVNCAGICKIADVLDFGRAEWDPMIAINLTGAFDLSHAVAKYMIPQKSGRIINICSLFSFLGGLGSPAYAAMKAGLMGLTKAYADELGKYGITVNGIAQEFFCRHSFFFCHLNVAVTKYISEPAYCPHTSADSVAVVEIFIRYTREFRPCIRCAF